MLLPIISIICLSIQGIFHQEIPVAVQDSLATGIIDLIALGVAAYGIFKNHHEVPVITVQKAEENSNPSVQLPNLP